MKQLSFIEECYHSYKNDLVRWIPEDIIVVDLTLLQRFNLLNEDINKPQEPPLSQYFQIIESPNKMTLISSQFVIWITSEKINNIAGTWTLIALNTPSKPHLELAFLATGVYNSSKLVLRLLEKFLFEIEENEKLLALLRNKKVG